jgi:hypothetical protein
LSFNFFRYFRRRDDEGADAGDIHDEVDPGKLDYAGGPHMPLVHADVYILDRL